MSDISEIQVGGTTYTIADATAREDIADLHNATVHIVDENIDINGGAPTASIYDRGITFDDVDGNSIGFIQLDRETDGNYGISFGVNSLDDSVTHQIALELKSDGTPKCWISQPTVVRNALSAAASSHTHGSISNTGAITSDTTVTSGDKLIISDSSDSSKLKRSNIALGTSTATFLRNDGTWATPPSSGGGISILENEGLPILSDSVINTDMERRLYYATPDVSQGIVAYLASEDGAPTYDSDLANISPLYGARIYVIFDAGVNCSLADCFGSSAGTTMRLATIDSQSQEVPLCPALPVVGGNGDYLYTLYSNNLLDTTAVFEFRFVNIFNSEENEAIDAWMLVGGNPRNGGSGGNNMVVLTYGSSTWADFEAAYNTNSIVYCRASGNADPSVAPFQRMAFMAYVNANPPTSVEFQYYRSISSHSASQQGDQVFIYKLDKTNGWSVTSREASTKIVAGSGLTQTYSSGTLTISAVAPTIPNEIVVTAAEPTGADVMLWVDPSNNATVMAAGVSF